VSPKFYAALPLITMELALAVQPGIEDSVELLLRCERLPAIFVIDVIFDYLLLGTRIF